MHHHVFTLNVPFLSLLRKLIKFVMSDLDKKFSFNRHFLMFFRNNDSSKIWHKKEPASATLPKGRMFITWLFPVFTSMLWSKLNHTNLFDTPFFSLISRPNLSRIPLNQLSILNSMCVPFFTKTDNKFER